ncbi:MAG: TonB-dependent receptor plug domain-containing protein [Bacteroidota bacterium]
MKTYTIILRNLLLFLGSILLCAPVFAQLTGSSLSPAKQAKVDSIRKAEQEALAEYMFRTRGPKPRPQGNSLRKGEFNPGHITDPLQLIQGKLPALMIARGGNDPNGPFDLRMRGLKSFDVTEPLYLVDGFPVASLRGIHPNDIESVKVLRGGAEAAIWGIRGANGVLSITTRSALDYKTRIRYQSYLSLEQITRRPDIMNAKDYKSFGGNDFGSETDWWEEVTERAVSHTHHVSLSGSLGNRGGYYASINLDQVEGVAIQSGFERLNGRLTIKQSALNERLNLQLGLSTNHRTSQLTQYYGFLQAISYNPTAPILGEGAEFDQYDGYFQHRTFSNYNPVALMRQNDTRSAHQTLMMQAKAELEIIDGITLSLQYGNHSEDREGRFFSPSTSVYIGENREGLATRSTAKRNNQFVSSQLEYFGYIHNLRIQAQLFHRYQDIQVDDFSVWGGNFLTDAFSFNNMSAANDFALGLGSVQSGKTSHQLSAMGGNIKLDYKDKFFLNATVSREGSSILGRDSKWGLFYGVQATAAITRLLRARASYGYTGNLPSSGMLSQQIYRPTGQQMFFNGNFVNSYGISRTGNPNLAWEGTRELVIGTDFLLKRGKIRGSVEYYSSQSSDLIQYQRVSVPPNLTDSRYENTGAINSSGLEYTLKFYGLASNKNFRWDMTVVGAKYFRTKLVSYGFAEGEDTEHIGILGGFCAFPVIQLKESENLGEIWGHELDPNRPVTADGSWNIIDQNGDGQIYRAEDRALLGNAMAKSSLGISNQFIWNKWEIDMFFRGVFGHDIIDHVQSFHSARTMVSVYNVSYDAKEELSTLIDWAEFTDRDVKRGSFLRLNHLNIQRKFSPKKTKPIEMIQAFLVLQNLFTITPYDGLNPEYRLEDRRGISPAVNRNRDGMVDYGDPLVLGMDRRDSYPASRSFVLGLKLEF